MQHIQLKNKASIDKMRTAGRRLAEILREVEIIVIAGKSTWEIDAFIDNRMKSVGLRAVCKGYGTYRHATCISINDVVVHGIPSKDTILKSGDFVKIDVVGSFENYCADMARYFFVGIVDPRVFALAKVAQEALDGAIAMARPGIYLSDLSAYIQETVEKAGFGVVRDFSGHGIGKTIHEAPEIPNYGKPGNGPMLREGMTLAIEPMITEKNYETVVMADGWTAKTRDGGLAAHVEDTVVITRDGVEILTRL